MQPATKTMHMEHADIPINKKVFSSGLQKCLIF